MVGAIFHAPRSSVAVPIALPYAGRANSLNDDERNFLKPPHPWTLGPHLPHAVLIGASC